MGSDIFGIRSAPPPLFGRNVVDNDLIVVAAAVDARRAGVQAQAEYIGPSTQAAVSKNPFVRLSWYVHPSSSVCMSILCPSIIVVILTS